MSLSMTSTFIKPMHPEGRKFVAIFAAITLVLFIIAEPLGWLGVGATVWCYYFFRDPERVTPKGDNLVISPADGIVSLIEPAVPPAELGMPDTPLTRVSVFMNVFNCHVNRAPVAGEITEIAYRPGKFFNASLDKASEDNERNSLRIKMADGRRPDRRSGGASYRVFHQEGRAYAGGSTLWSDPLWIARRCLPARGGHPARQHWPDDGRRRNRAGRAFLR